METLLNFSSNSSSSTSISFINSTHSCGLSVLVSFKVKDNDIPGTLTFACFCFSLYFFARALCSSRSL